MADTLRRAAHYIAEHGHHRYDYFASGTRRTDRETGTLPAACAIGAISYAAYGRVRRDPWGSYTDLTLNPTNGFSDAVLFFEDYTKSHFGNTVSGWNDAPNRTADEVVTTLHAAADAFSASAGDAR
ncbi:DUF6197 family protein [Dactylosporangium sp. McL0621]|uniref:DUF6197 family protein n=1 Tax=Dactylosporangium sp. McL0621 TaxID=3415678 RepID=UPI003CEA9EB0